MKYMIQALDKSGNWDESAVGNDTEANTFKTRRAAEKMIPRLVRVFASDETPPTADDFRVVERKLPPPMV